MEQKQLSGAITAAYLLIVAAGAVLYFRGTASGRRKWMTFEPRHRFLLTVCLAGWVSWVASTKVLRPWAEAIGLEGQWILGVAPSLFAGATLTAFTVFVLAIAHRRLEPLSAFLLGAGLTLLVEVTQLWLPGYVFDPFDVLAGICGAALVAMLLSRYPRRS